MTRIMKATFSALGGAALYAAVGWLEISHDLSSYPWIRTSADGYRWWDAFYTHHNMAMSWIKYRWSGFGLEILVIGLLAGLMIYLLSGKDSRS